MVNICYLNSTRKWRQTNARCIKRYLELNKPVETKDLVFVYNGEVEKYTVAKGMPIIATTNLKELDTSTFVISSIRSNGIKLTNIVDVIPFELFRKSFIVNFCSLRCTSGRAGRSKSHTLS